MVHPVSPITKAAGTKLFAQFKAEDVIRLYHEQLNIDVSRFFTNNSVFNLYKCTQTGYKFYHPQELAGDGKFYESLQRQLGSEYYHGWKFENQLALNQIKNGDEVLDIGCGTGNFLARVKEKTNEAYGLELNDEAVNVCRSRGLNVYREFIQDHAASRKGFYDVVCAFQVLEHIYDVKEFIESTLSVLKKDGKLIIGVPNNEPYFLGYDKYCTLNLPPHHIGLWNKEVFKNFASIFNLQIEKVEYDTKGRMLTEAYLRAKYLAGIKSLGGRHSLTQKIIMSSLALITLPEAFVKKLTRGLHGSHMALVFRKLN